MTLDPGAFLPLFVEEAESQLLLLERSLHRLEDDASDGQAVRAAFQAAHSFKGGAAMLELHGLRLVTGAFEDLLQRWRDDASRAGQGWLALSFAVRDHLRASLGQLTPGLPATMQEEALAAALKAASVGEAVPDAPVIPGTLGPAPTGPEPASPAPPDARTAVVMEDSRLAGEAVADLLRSLGARVTLSRHARPYAGETLGVVSGQLAGDALRLGWPPDRLSVLSERPDRVAESRQAGLHAQGRPRRDTPPHALPAFWLAVLTSVPSPTPPERGSP